MVYLMESSNHPLIVICDTKEVLMLNVVNALRCTISIVPVMALKWKEDTDEIAYQSLYRVLF